MTTNANRMVQRAGPSVSCIEFGLRRAQGPNGALTATKYAVLGGFKGSSNVYAGQLYGIPISGTIAHSYIMSFDSDEKPEGVELDGVNLIEEGLKLRDELGWTNTILSELYAFLSYGSSYPENFLCLVDTFDTIESGCRNFLIGAILLEKLGYKAKGIRLDSGDLAQLSKDAKVLFKEVGE